MRPGDRIDIPAHLAELIAILFFRAFLATGNHHHGYV